MEKYLPNLLTGLWVIALCAAILAVSRVVRPAQDRHASKTTFDGGEPPQGKPWIKLVANYHLVMVTATLFCSAMLFLYPTFVDFKSWVLAGRGAEVFFKIGLFLTTLSCAIAYAWKKRDLDWKTGLVSDVEDDDGVT